MIQSPITTRTEPVSRRALAVLAATSLLASALLVPSTAQAAPVVSARVAVDESDVPVTAGISGTAARTLADSLGADRTGGVYLDDTTGQLVVAVTDEAAAQSVRDAGGVPELVKYSTTTLTSIHTELDKLGGAFPGTSWGVDPSTNQVSVELDSTVDAADTAKLTAVTDRFGDAVRVERVPGTLTTMSSTTGGQSIFPHQNSGPACSIGFNVTNSGGDRYFITAGHCTEAFPNWWQAWSGIYLGYRVQGSYPVSDWGLVRYYPSSVIAYGTVHHDTQQITYARDPFDDESASRAGGVSNDMVGKVLLTNTSVTFPNGDWVTGLIKTTHCGRHGDSGGPLYHGATALGVLSGGTGDQLAPCNDAVSNERSYFQPVRAVLDAYGLAVY